MPLWTFSAPGGSGAPRVLVSVIVGTIGGLLGGVVGQKLFGLLSLSVFFVFGWAVTGLLIGASLGTFDVLSRFVRQEDTQGARRRSRAEPWAAPWADSWEVFFRW